MEHSEHRNKEGGDHEMVLIFGAIIVFIALSAWFAKESDVFIGWWKILYLPQAKAIAWFSTTFLGELINHLLGHTSGQASGLVQFIENTSAHDMTAHFCWEASSFLGKYYLFVFIPLGSYLTIKVYKKTQGESEVYQKFKNAKEFAQFVIKNAIDSHELLDEANQHKNSGQYTKDINQKLFQDTLSVLDFAKSNGLLAKEAKNKKAKSDQNSLQINTKNTFQCFIEQLGREFTYMEDLINQPYGWVAIKMIQFIPEKYRVKVLEESTQSHFYDFTVLIALLGAARQYGVVTSAIFIRLKKNYPSLWYGLNNLGRKTVFIEGAGLSAQYAYEIFLKKSENNKKNKKEKLRKVEAAIEGFKDAIHDEENKS